MNALFQRTIKTVQRLKLGDKAERIAVPVKEFLTGSKSTPCDGCARTKQILNLTLPNEH